MEALALLARVAAAGYYVEARGDELLVRGPRHGHEEVLRALRGAKPAILAVLATGSVAAGDAGVATARELRAMEACYCCAGTQWWRLSAGCPWVCARCHPSDRPDAELEWSERRTGLTPLPGDPPSESRYPLPTALADAEVDRA